MPKFKQDIYLEDAQSAVFQDATNLKSGSIHQEGDTLKIRGNATDVTIDAGNNLIFKGGVAAIGGVNSILTLGRSGDTVALDAAGVTYSIGAATITGATIVNSTINGVTPDSSTLLTSVQKTDLTDGGDTTLHSHTQYSLRSEDDRDIKPNITPKGYLRTYFTSKEGLTGASGTDYQDFIVLNTYTDSSGGLANALAFDKSEFKIVHYQANVADTSWGTPKTLAYDTVVTTSVNGLMIAADKSKLDGIAAGATANTGTVTSVAAGNGLSFTTITGTGSVALGTPSTLSASTTNGVTSTSHTHAITTSSAGAVSTIVATDASGNFSAGTISATLNGGIARTVAVDTTFDIAYGSMASNDYYRIRVGGASNAGYMEIATADDGAEPIYVRQYTGVFATLARTATLLDASGNTTFPGTVQGTRLISTQATGTAPLTVTSTTMVANLNADMVDGLHTATAGTASTVAARDASGNLTAADTFNLGTAAMMKYNATTKSIDFIFA